jgi:site-specific recombinase XerD
LTWGEIQETQGKYSIVYRQQKTQDINYLPLSKQALSYMGEKTFDDDKVFNLFNHSSTINHQLRDWSKTAGINKNITYHSSRHTFAVMQLSLGTPIFTVQKLLGHADISSTMIYANIVDSKKEEAMNKIGDVL